MNPKIINGPVPDTPGGIIYNITLPSGLVVTDPSAFQRDATPPPPYERFVVTGDGRVLSGRDKL
jgi:hypothetical protein